jgi:hypothetical protein
MLLGAFTGVKCTFFKSVETRSLNQIGPNRKEKRFFALEGKMTPFDN